MLFLLPTFIISQKPQHFSPKTPTIHTLILFNRSLLSFSSDLGVLRLNSLDLAFKEFKFFNRFLGMCGT